MKYLLINGSLRIVCALCICCLYSCEDESDKVIIDETQGIEYEIGDEYIDKYGNRGTVCKKKEYAHSKSIMVVSADEVLASWGPLDLKVAPYDSLRLYSMDHEDIGIAMLQCARALGIEKFPAQKWCDDKNHGEKFVSGSSWHLPTNGEVEYFFGRFNTESKYYWSCIEDIQGCDGSTVINGNYLPKDRAMPVNLDGDSFKNKDLWVKRNKYYVRAVKYIYYERD